jgi:hypothetical protein
VGEGRTEAPDPSSTINHQPSTMSDEHLTPNT